MVMKSGEEGEENKIERERDFPLPSAWRSNRRAVVAVHVVVVDVEF